MLGTGFPWLPLVPLMPLISLGFYSLFLCYFRFRSLESRTRSQSPCFGVVQQFLFSRVSFSAALVVSWLLAPPITKNQIATLVRPPTGLGASTHTTSSKTATKPRLSLNPKHRIASLPHTHTHISLYRLRWQSHSLSTSLKDITITTLYHHDKRIHRQIDRIPDIHSLFALIPATRYHLTINTINHHPIVATRTKNEKTNSKIIPQRSQ